MNHNQKVFWAECAKLLQLKSDQVITSDPDPDPLAKLRAEQPDLFTQSAGDSAADIAEKSIRMLYALKKANDPIAQLEEKVAREVAELKGLETASVIFI